MNSTYKISKKDWYNRGGFTNSDLFRKQLKGIWLYYAGAKGWI